MILRAIARNQELPKANNATNHAQRGIVALEQWPLHNSVATSAQNMGWHMSPTGAVLAGGRARLGCGMHGAMVVLTEARRWPWLYGVTGGGCD